MIERVVFDFDPTNWCKIQLDGGVVVIRQCLLGEEHEAAFYPWEFDFAYKQYKELIKQRQKFPTYAALRVVFDAPFSQKGAKGGVE